MSSNYIAVAPIGPVNLHTGLNNMLGKVPEVWSGTILLVEDGNGTLRGMATCGEVTPTVAAYPVNSFHEFRHDQTRKIIGMAYLQKVVGHYPMNYSGLLAIHHDHKITALQMCTFK